VLSILKIELTSVTMRRSKVLRLPFPYLFPALTVDLSQVLRRTKVMEPKRKGYKKGLMMKKERGKKVPPPPPPMNTKPVLSMEFMLEAF